MIRLTNLADYAVVLMSRVSASDVRLSAQDLAEVCQLPVPTVSKILNSLGRAGLLQSHRGIKGGFSLARSSDTISVADIVEAIDGPIAMTNCVADDKDACALEHVCGVQPHWEDINGAVKQALDGVKLASIASKTNARNIKQPAL